MLRHQPSRIRLGGVCVPLNEQVLGISRPLFCLSLYLMWPSKVYMSFNIVPAKTIVFVDVAEFLFPAEHHRLP